MMAGVEGVDSVPACCIHGEATKRLVQILRYNKTTRIIRVALMTLRNLIGKGVNADLIDFGVIDVLNSLATKKFPDEDIPHDVAFSLSALVKDVKDMRYVDSDCLHKTTAVLRVPLRGRQCCCRFILGDHWPTLAALGRSTGRRLSAGKSPSRIRVTRTRRSGGRTSCASRTRDSK